VSQDEEKTLPEDDLRRGVELAGLVEYASDSIVSRTLAETRTGTVTLFAFDAGQALSEHSAPYDALVYVVAGRVELTIGGKPVDAPAGRLVRMPADVPHAVRAPERMKMLLIMLRGEPPE
jgi:quercetin dioxygenase-like cupin family protein